LCRESVVTVEGAPSYTEQIILAHHPQHVLVVDRETTLLQFGGQPVALPVMVEVNFRLH
jgi:hypothetical protein